MKEQTKRSLKILSFGIYAMILVFVALKMNPAQAKGYLGMNYGILDGCKATSFVVGDTFTEFFSVELGAMVDSSSCYRDGKKIEIDSMISANFNLSIPTLNDSWYIELSCGHTQLSRIGASGFGGTTCGFGGKYYLREAYSVKGMYSEIGDIGYFKLEGRINF